MPLFQMLSGVSAGLRGSPRSWHSLRPPPLPPSHLSPRGKLTAALQYTCSLLDWSLLCGMRHCKLHACLPSQALQHSSAEHCCAAVDWQPVGVMLFGMGPGNTEACLPFKSSGLILCCVATYRNQACSLAWCPAPQKPTCFQALQPPSVVPCRGAAPWQPSAIELACCHVLATHMPACLLLSPW